MHTHMQLQGCSMTNCCVLDVVVMLLQKYWPSIQQIHASVDAILRTVSTESYSFFFSMYILTKDTNTIHHQNMTCKY